MVQLYGLKRHLEISIDVKTRICYHLNTTYEIQPKCNFIEESTVDFADLLAKS